MKRKSVLCTALSAALTICISAECFAAPPSPSCDETLYVNLDSYGGMVSTSVVKSYSLNGSEYITDFGDYGEVVNMTDYTEPQKGDGQTTFDFSKSAQTPRRFYFEGKDPVLTTEIPWDIDVSYKLNGVPYKAEELSGKSGLIEIDIDVIPNTNAREYYKNNMLLEAACIVDLDDALSIEAPGAQVQTVGSLKAIVFFALPGEEQHFSVYIGSDNFEFSGMMFMMQPATISQTEKIADLRDAKETVEDSADAINESLDVILNTLDSMQSSFSQTSEGLAALNEARETIQNSKGQVYDNADTAIEDMKALADALEPYKTNFDSAGKALDDINSNINGLNNSIQAFSDTLADLGQTSQNIKNDLDAISSLIDEMDTDSERWNNALERLSNNADKISDVSEDIKVYLKGIESAGNNLGQSLEYLSSDPSVSYISDSLMDSFSEAGDINSGGIWAVLYSIQYLSSDLSDLSRNAGNLAGVLAKDEEDKNGGIDIDSITENIKELSELSKNAVNNISSHNEDYKAIVEDSQDILQAISDASEKADISIKAINDATETANKYKSDIQSFIDNSQVLVERSKTQLNSINAFLTSLEALMKTSGEQLNTGTEESLNGLIDILTQSISGLSQTGTIKNAKDTIKDLVDDKWDEYTGEDNNALKIDSSLSPVSFTSDSNSPNSVQIILRTEEITVDDEPASNVNEDAGAPGTIFTRIGAIIKKIISAVTSIFK